MFRKSVWIRQACLAGAFALSMGLGTPLSLAAEKNSSTPKTKARQVFLVEYPPTGVLFEKKSKSAMAPSSMTKLMTAFLVMEALQEGRVKETDIVTISKRASRSKGSRLRLRRKSKHTVMTLLEAMIIYSANDATVALAEHLGKTEKNFAKMMTSRAKALGLDKSQFRNATGFNAKGHRMSALDIATLSALIIAKFPNRYPLFARTRFQFGGKTYKNRNPILGRVAGADGLKTGQTTRGGYGLAASATRNGRRLILVINGLKSAKARRVEATRLLEWGFRQLAQK